MGSLNTYTNADKLLAAAEELAHTGECDPDEIYSVAHELEAHVTSFAARVEQRRRRLDLAVLFYTHEKELSNWVDELRQGTAGGTSWGEIRRTLCNDESVAEGLEATERQLEQTAQHRDQSLDACASTIAQGEALLQELRAINTETLETIWMFSRTRLIAIFRSIGEMDSTGSVSAVESALDRLAKQGTTSKNSGSVSQLEMWSEELQHSELTRDIAKAEQFLRLHNEGVSQMQNTTYQVLQQGQELVQVFETSGICVMADAQYNAQTRVQVLLEFLHDREMDLEDLAEVKEVEKEHEQFQVAIEKTHTSAVQVKHRADALINGNHYDPQSIRDISEEVTKRWQQLVTCAEERHKLVTASLNFYKTAEQVCSVLDSLEREYRRDEDWCSTGQQNVDKATAISQLINKHQEQKEAFLKACTLARRTAETFLKYTTRSLQFYSYPNTSGNHESRVKGILEKLLSQENKVLEHWTQRKKRLDQSNLGNNIEETESLLREHNEFKATAKETRERVKLLIQLADSLVEKGHAHACSIKQWVAAVDNRYKDFSSRMEQYRQQLEETLGIQEEESEKKELSIDRNSDPSLEAKVKEAAAKDLKELNEEKRRSARRKERATTNKRSRRLGDQLFGAGLLCRRLFKALGCSSISSIMVFGFTHADKTNYQIAVDIELVAIKLYSDFRFIMAELLQTERTYVKDLETCISCFLQEMKNSTNVPATLQGREQIIFGNMEEIYNFHNSIFLRELEKYETMPEDVGHCLHHVGPKVRHVRALLQEQARIQQSSGPARRCLPDQARAEEITKYQLLLKDLQSCCQEGQGEIKDGLEVMLNVPKKANDAMHLSLLEGCDISADKLGEVVLQDAFSVWDPKQLIREGGERHIFLFEMYLLFTKEVKDSAGKVKYIYKNKLMTSELGVTEHMEGDECKFAVWTGRAPISDYRIVLRASSLETKQLWVKKLREVIQETYFSGALPLSLPKSPAKLQAAQSEIEQTWRNATRWTSVENLDRNSLASFGSGNTTDSDKV
ncbi:hypothetical protein NQ317_000215 [Molorchus minor]|uniref:Uncharacterized protein n=1 Tax=Molorchus minor TaxID=1323400 RepID=A0ABQ9JHM0_9CUCU|nr:hypothetical protein NQ317_000215 [Molorchus minor]